MSQQREEFGAVPLSRRDSLRYLAAGAVCLAVDRHVLSQAPAAPAIGHEDATTLPGAAGGLGPSPWSMHDKPEVVADAMKGLPPLPPGPYQPTWESVQAQWHVPEWFRDAKFGIYMHWGIFSVPAHASEWYVRYMYGGNADVMKWHTEHFGPPTRFGYKDFLPMYTAAQWDPDAWAKLFKQAGARYVYAPGEHHDGFSNWNSRINRYNAVNYGPHRDLDGDLIHALERQGLKTGVSNHSNPHFYFVPPMPGTDQYDPEWAAFYSVADRSDAARSRFLHDWLTKNMELIDLYRPDMLWFDIGGRDRTWDPLKLYLLAYYYNRAASWGRQVAVSAKGEAFLAGMIMDYEREGRAPLELTDWIWQPDDPIQDKFGYVEGIHPAPAGSFVAKIVENTSKNGNLLLNISPRADGTIPHEQVDVLLAIGAWLEVNGEAIYATRPWVRYGEGPSAEAAAAAMVKLRSAGFPGRTNGQNVGDAQVSGGGLPKHGYTPQDLRFTRKGDTLYAFLMKWPADQAEVVVTSLGRGKAPAGKITRVELLGRPGLVQFTQDETGLRVRLPPERPCDFAWALKITGLKLGPVAPIRTA